MEFKMMWLLSWGLYVLAWLLFIVGIVSLFKPSFLLDDKDKAESKAPPKRSQIVVGFGIISTVLWGLSHWAEPTKTSAVAKKKEAGAEISANKAETGSHLLQESIDSLSSMRGFVSAKEENEGGKKTLKINLKPSAGNDVSNFFFMASRQATDMVNELLKEHRDIPVDRISFFLIGTLQDKYRNETDEPIVKLSFLKSELLKINTKDREIAWFSLLELAEPIKYLSPVGRQVVGAYCESGESYLKWSETFCSQSTNAG
jgi:hypothetical protein